MLWNIQPSYAAFVQQGVFATFLDFHSLRSLAWRVFEKPVHGHNPMHTLRALAHKGLIDLGVTAGIRAMRSITFAV